MNEPTRVLRFDAEDLSRAWMGCFAAASNDEKASVFYRSLNMVVNDDQTVTLVASDTHILLTSEVPATSDFRSEEYESVTVYDGDYRGRDLMKFAYKTVTAKDATPETIEMEIGPFPTDDDQFGGFEARGMTLTFPADKEPRESVSMKLHDLNYPDMAALLAKAEPVPTEQVAILPEYLNKLSAVRKYWPAPMHFTFGGPTALIQLRTKADFVLDRELTGAVMPVRVIEDEAIADPETGEKR